MIIINFIQFIVPVVLILLLLYRSSPDFLYGAVVFMVLTAAALSYLVLAFFL